MSTLPVAGCLKYRDQPCYRDADWEELGDMGDFSRPMPSICEFLADISAVDGLGNLQGNRNAGYESLSNCGTCVSGPLYGLLSQNENHGLKQQECRNRR